jgi:hypothetical protein
MHRKITDHNHSYFRLPFSNFVACASSLTPFVQWLRARVYGKVQRIELDWVMSGCLPDASLSAAVAVGL